MAALLRVLLLPLRSALGRRLVLAVIALGAIWWWQGERIRRWLGPPRLPEGRVGMDLEREAESPEPADFAARYDGLTAEQLDAHLAALEATYAAERRSALDRRRAAGDVIERPYAAGAAGAVPPEVPADAIYEVVYDPVESRRTPVVWTVWLPREGHGRVYELRDELALLRRRASAAR